MSTDPESASPTAICSTLVFDRFPMAVASPVETVPAPGPLALSADAKSAGRIRLSSWSSASSSPRLNAAEKSEPTWFPPVPANAMPRFTTVARCSMCRTALPRPLALTT